MLLTTKKQNNFPQSLKTIRKARGLSQEAFSFASSRTYVSSLERGLRTPTINKVDELAEVLEIHPLTLLTMSYVNAGDYKEASSLMDHVLKELQNLLSTK